MNVTVRGVLTDGFGAAPGSCDAALLFNILHCEEPVAVLRAAYDVLRPGGLVSVIHWHSDIATPRGPSAAIRPSPEQIQAWAAIIDGLAATESPFILLPWHYDVSLRKTVNCPCLQ